MKMRDLIRIVENAGSVEVEHDPVEAHLESYITATEKALEPIAASAILLVHDTDTRMVELHDLSAHTPGQGAGTKAMTIITALADQFQVNLFLEVADNAGDDDDWDDGDSDDDDDDDGAGDEPEPRGLMGYDELVGWYGRYGFTYVAYNRDRAQMMRKFEATAS